MGTPFFPPVLDAPGNGDGRTDKYSCQIVTSWPLREGFFDSPAPLPFPPTNEARLALLKTFAQTWAEPFRSLVLAMPPDTDVKHFELVDFAPPKDLRTKHRVVLMGDALHAMAMCKSRCRSGPSNFRH